MKVNDILNITDNSTTIQIWQRKFLSEGSKVNPLVTYYKNCEVDFITTTPYGDLVIEIK